MDKKIGRYSLVDLLEVLEDKNHSSFLLAKNELSNRNPSEEELKIAENGLAIRTLAKNKSLSSKEKFNAYLIPFHMAVTGSGWTFYKRMNLEFEKQIKEFKDYGELKKAEEFDMLKKRVSQSVPIFTLIVIILGFLIAYII